MDRQELLQLIKDLAQVAESVDRNAAMVLYGLAAEMEISDGSEMAEFLKPYIEKRLKIARGIRASKWN